MTCKTGHVLFPDCCHSMVSTILRMHVSYQESMSLYYCFSSKQLISLTYFMWLVPMHASVCIPRPNKGVLACSFLLPHHLWNAFSHSSPSHEEWLKLLAWNSLCRVTNKYLRTEWQQASTPVKRFHISLWQPQAAQETAPLNTTHQTNTRHRH